MISDRRVDKYSCPFNTFFIGIFKGLKLLTTEKQKEREAFFSFNFKCFSSDTEILTLNNKQVIKYQTSAGMTANKEEYENQTAELQIKIIKHKKSSRGTFQRPIKRENLLTAIKRWKGY